HLCIGAAASRSLTHRERQASVHHVDDLLPRLAPAGRRPRADPGLRLACLRAPAIPHVSRRQTPRASLTCLRRHPRRGGGRMIRIGTAQLWVHDQDEALAFYTKQVGMEVRSDVTVPEL